MLASGGLAAGFARSSEFEDSVDFSVAVLWTFDRFVRIAQDMTKKPHSSTAVLWHAGSLQLGHVSQEKSTGGG
jgi:hypothetical protein